MPGLLTESQKKDKKYTKLLNNLLAIKHRDQALFTKINNIDSFDITTKFGKEVTKKILNKKDFKINVNEIDLENLLIILQTSTSAKEIIAGFVKHKEKLFNTKKLLLENPETFETTRKEMIENIIIKIQKAKNRWIQFRRKVIDANIQENIWQLHVATFFITIKTLTKEIYAPLLLKEANFSINNNEITITSEGSWKINEKLIFILNEEGYGIQNEILFENQTALECAITLSQYLNLNIENIDFGKEFVDLTNENIKTKAIEIKPGIILGMFKPSGGHLRKTMLEIIEKEEVDEILNPEVNKEIYEKNVSDFLKNHSDNLFKIQRSNFSQDKALVSALIQDTVIWGPPGTGKSQVITNIIANILAKEKTAIVMSQKKAALDVLKKRLGKISPFALFILNDNKMNKEEFYKPLKQFVETVEYSTEIKKIIKPKIIDDKEINAINLIIDTKKQGIYEPSLALLEIFQGNEIFLAEAFNLSANYQYLNSNANLFDYKTYETSFAKINNIQKTRKIFIKKYPNDFVESSQSSFQILGNNCSSPINLNQIVSLTQKTNFDTVINLVKAGKYLERQNSYHSDEDYIANLLANKTLKKIKQWQETNIEKYNAYKKFAAAVRASRRIPYKFMNDHISIIKELFPVIITTPETSFINWEKKYFDYIILDESSQMFIEIGLPILYLAKIKILAGDTEQMQPTNWFTVRNETDDEEEDVAENAESVLNYALDKGTYHIMLDQNFRSSAASLMSFSAKHFYNSQLDVIDKNTKEKEQRIIVKNINGKWYKSINEVEADEVITTIKKIMDKYNSIIVLTFNLPQRQFIEKLIIDNHPDILQLLEEEKLSIRNIENVQGDEADVVIISVVYDEQTNISSTYVVRPGGKNALNVAISRAKEQIIVIKSVTSQTIKFANSADFLVFKNWLEFLDLEEKHRRTYSIPEVKYKLIESHGKTDSKFERNVIDELKAKILTNKKLKIIKQYEVGSKKIDIAIINEDKQFKLGIEVDGYWYHEGKGINKYLDDLSRQEFLESKGYPIYRIKEIDWKIKREKIINEIKYLINK